jgi:hypothetical protein
MANITSLRLSGVCQLKHLSLDYSKLDPTTLTCVLFGHLQATISATLLETLEVLIPAYTRGDEELLVDCLQEIDSELAGAIDRRLDASGIRPFDVIMRGAADLEKVNSQDTMPHVIGRGHHVILLRE